jgi:hypothetical protein
MSDRTRRPGRPGSSGSSGLDEADIQLLERLGAIADIVDPVPEHVLEMSRALFAFRDPDAELMQAVELEGDRVAAVRGSAPTSRLHFFEFGELSLDLELTISGGFCDVVGVFTHPGGPGGASVTVDTVGASFTTEPDADGRFEVRRVPVGMARITVTREGEDRHVTPWFEAR